MPIGEMSGASNNWPSRASTAGNSPCSESAIQNCPQLAQNITPSQATTDVPYIPVITLVSLQTAPPLPDKLTREQPAKTFLVETKIVQNNANDRLNEKTENLQDGTPVPGGNRGYLVRIKNLNWEIGPVFFNRAATIFEDEVLIFITGQNQGKKVLEEKKLADNVGGVSPLKYASPFWLTNLAQILAGELSDIPILIKLLEEMASRKKNNEHITSAIEFLKTTKIEKSSLKKAKVIVFEALREYYHFSSAEKKHYKPKFEVFKLDMYEAQKGAGPATAKILEDLNEPMIDPAFQRLPNDPMLEVRLYFQLAQNASDKKEQHDYQSKLKTKLNNLLEPKNEKAVQDILEIIRQRIMYGKMGWDPTDKDETRANQDLVPNEYKAYQAEALRLRAQVTLEEKTLDRDKIFSNLTSAYSDLEAAIKIATGFELLASKRQIADVLLQIAEFIHGYPQTYPLPDTLKNASPDTMVSWAQALIKQISTFDDEFMKLTDRKEPLFLSSIVNRARLLEAKIEFKNKNYPKALKLAESITTTEQSILNDTAILKAQINMGLFSLDKNIDLEKEVILPLSDKIGPKLEETSLENYQLSQALQVRAQAQTALKNWNAAMADINRSLSVYKNADGLSLNYFALLDKADFYSRRNLHAEAIEIYNQVGSKDSKYAKILLPTQKNHIKLGRAEAALRQKLQPNPYNDATAEIEDLTAAIREIKDAPSSLQTSEEYLREHAVGSLIEAMVVQKKKELPKAEELFLSIFPSAPQTRKSILDIVGAMAPAEKLRTFFFPLVDLLIDNNLLETLQDRDYGYNKKLEDLAGKENLAEILDKNPALKARHQLNLARLAWEKAPSEINYQDLKEKATAIFGLDTSKQEPFLARRAANYLIDAAIYKHDFELALSLLHVMLGETPTFDNQGRLDQDKLNSSMEEAKKILNSGNGSRLEEIFKNDNLEKTVWKYSTRDFKLNIAEILLWNESLERAAAFLSGINPELLTSDMQRIKYWTTYGDVAVKQKEYAAAVKYYQKAEALLQTAAKDPGLKRELMVKKPELYIKTGIASLKEGLEENAKLYFDRAIAAATDDLNALQKLHPKLREMQEYDLLLFMELNTLWMDALTWKEDYKAAKKLGEGMLKSLPQKSPSQNYTNLIANFHVRLGDIYRYRLFSFEDSERHYNEAIELFKNTSQLSGISNAKVGLARLYESGEKDLAKKLAGEIEESNLTYLSDEEQGGIKRTLASLGHTVASVESSFHRDKENGTESRTKLKTSFPVANFADLLSATNIDNKGEYTRETISLGLNLYSLFSRTYLSAEFLYKLGMAGNPNGHYGDIKYYSRPDFSSTFSLSNRHVNFLAASEFDLANDRSNHYISAFMNFACLNNRHLSGLGIGADFLYYNFPVEVKYLTKKEEFSQTDYTFRAIIRPTIKFEYDPGNLGFERLPRNYLKVNFFAKSALFQIIPRNVWFDSEYRAIYGSDYTPELRNNINGSLTITDITCGTLGGGFSLNLASLLGAPLILEGNISLTNQFNYRAKEGSEYIVDNQTSLDRALMLKLNLPFTPTQNFFHKKIPNFISGLFGGGPKENQ